MLLDLAKGGARSIACAKHANHAAITRDFKHLAVDDDRVLRIDSLPEGHPEATVAGASSPRLGAGQGLVAAEATWGGRIRVWRAATGRLAATAASGDYSGPHDDSEWTFDPAGSRLVILADKMLGRWGREALRVVDARSGRVLWTRAIRP